MGRKLTKVKASDVGVVIAQTLDIYSQAVQEALAEATTAAMQELVTETKKTAPKGSRGKFRRSITSTEQKLTRGVRSTWHVKAPEYRLTHLLVHGHATKNGGRTKGDPFLQNAVDRVLPAYEEQVREVLKNASK